MYAVIKAGAHQYRVKEGDIIKIDKVEGDEGDSITFDQVLMCGSEGNYQVGAPFLSGAKVSASIAGQHREKKILVFKFKRRQGYKKKQGHKQPITRIKIGKISI